jgi:hypothetical protein
VRGAVDEKGKIVAGNGSKVKHPSTGVFRIEFEAGSFSGPPSVTASQLAVGEDSSVTDNALPGSINEGGVTVYLGSASDKRIDRPFSIIATGPR